MINYILAYIGLPFFKLSRIYNCNYAYWRATHLMMTSNNHHSNNKRIDFDNADKC